jgi:hypothetical protein
VECVERPYDLDLEASLLFGFSIYRVDSRLPLPHAAAAEVPFTGSVILVVASFQEKHVATALNEEGHDDQEPSAVLGPGFASARSLIHR